MKHGKCAEVAQRKCMTDLMSCERADLSLRCPQVVVAVDAARQTSVHVLSLITSQIMSLNSWRQANATKLYRLVG